LAPAGRERFEAWLYAPSRATVRATGVGFTSRLYFYRSIDIMLAHRPIDDQIAESSTGLARLQQLYLCWQFPGSYPDHTVGDRYRF